MSICFHLLDLSIICDLARCIIVKQPYEVNVDNFSSMYLHLYRSVDELHIDPTNVEQCICVIVYIYTECIRNQVNPLDFGDVIRGLEVNTDQLIIMEKMYNLLVLSSLNL